MGTNKRLGDEAEREACEILHENGWWCHRMAATESGQPCDIVAMRRGENMLIDSKNCEKPYLRTSRIEPNQAACFEFASKLGIKCGFMCRHLGSFFWIGWESVDMGAPHQEFSSGIEEVIR